MTRKPAPNRVTFSKPIATARHYVSQGPSGWTETFPRAALDAELQKWLGSVPVPQAVSLFGAQRELSDRITTWETVLGFLGRLFDISPFDVPTEVGLAFWGQVELVLSEGANQ